MLAALMVAHPAAGQSLSLPDFFREPMEIAEVRRFMADGGFGEPAPGAPEVAAGFGRLTGMWLATQEVLQQDGTWVQGEPALWTWKYALGGFAVQDLWLQHRDHVPEYLGELDRHYLLGGLRVYDVSAGKWKVAWAANGGGQAIGADFGTMEASDENGRIVMMSPPGQYGLQRVIFHDITKDRFRWVSEYSQDDGETWTAVMRVEARRIR